MVVMALTAMAAVTVCAQTANPATNVLDTWQFAIDGTSYLAHVHREAVTSGASWDTAQPLPLSFSKVEQIARKELRKLAKDEPAWEVESFQLQRLKHTQQWYYVVGFHPPAKGHKDSYAYVLIDASGKAGSIEKGRLK